MAQHAWMDDGAPSIGAGQIRSPYALDPGYLPKGPEFIFPVEAQRKSWNDKMFERTGSCYMTGLIIGGGWGLWEGLNHPEGRTRRLRMTSILNACTRRGPFLANNGAILAMTYSPLRTLLGSVRGEDDYVNSIAAAGMTGVLYKSTAGLRALSIAGVTGCTIAGLYHVATAMLNM